jgi:hypothetical protein
LTDTFSTKRRYRVSFRVSTAERQSLDAAAQRSCLRLSQYFRVVLLGIKPGRARRPAVEAALLARILAKLGVIASALTDIARLASRELTLLPSTERDLAQNLRGFSECRSKILRATGRKAPPP